MINHVSTLCSAPEAEPQTYWINSSGNDLVKLFIDKADKTTRDEIEQLLAGETIEKEIRLELTYDEIDSSIDNLWSVLFTTGYLTQVGKPKNGVYKLRIPNKEVWEVYRTQIRDWFAETVQSDKDGLRPLWRAFADGNAREIEEILTKIMGRTISVLDPKGSETEKEKFYHAFLSGILVGNGTWGILSNKESGDGFADILVEMDDPDAGLVIELSPHFFLPHDAVLCTSLFQRPACLPTPCIINPCSFPAALWVSQLCLPTPCVINPCSFSRSTVFVTVRPSLSL